MPALVTSELRAPATGPAEGVLGDVLRRAVELGPDDVLLTTPATGERWSAAQLLADATSLATGLLQLAGPGARVATCLANGPAPVLVQLGVALAGAEAPSAVEVWSVLADMLGFTDYRLVADEVSGLHPTRAARIVVADRNVGAVGEIDPGVLEAFDVSERVAWLEVDLDPPGAISG